ncbi:MAG: desulfoferrodoxin [Synergistaceae bacterium]|nr:desulfoferrodoxin [Synergistaceae bacterium]
MERLSVFKCAKCGNIVEVMHVGGGTLVCCGEPMKQLKENTTDAATEKHVPVLDGKKVKVGSVAHPMADDHYIEWVEVIRNGGERVARCFLKPGEEPAAEFKCVEAGVTMREYCNKHGLWKAEA